MVPFLMIFLGDFLMTIYTYDEAAGVYIIRT